MPLQYDPARAVIIAATNTVRLEEELRAYNIDPASPGLRVVYTAADVTAVAGLDPSTPWCIVGGTGPGIALGLVRRFGPSLTFPHAMAVYERDLAWRRDKIPDTTFQPTYEAPPTDYGPFPNNPFPPPPLPPGFDYVVIVDHGEIIYLTDIGGNYIMAPQ